MNRRSLLASLAASAVAAPAYAQFSIGNLIQSAVTVAGAYTTGESDEIEMGESYYQGYLSKSGGVYPDSDAQEALQTFAQPLINAADRSALAWDITLVESDQVNAWALPGGKIAINSALVSQCRTPDELASVIAHEIGHADRGHGLAQIRNQALISSAGSLGKEALGAWIGGGAGAIGGEVLSALEGPLYGMILSGYSRDHEFEADAHILKIFARTGYDPNRADDFFHTLLRLHPQSDTTTTSLFSTHPGTTERIARIEQAAAKTERRNNGAQTAGWDELKELFPTPAG
ncbi:M48 family metallopeptidase [Magnetospirillum sulfuroxidans]|uniref:M48 family metallopeptidase n=1 Tax=Magnetospirillum sulfuroxidans TaxID=611300 RepID=A0ABS5IB98_9PROT|nr:M48 family metallopeptidase [Magnetospirillum sulfuroxidans]MBR9971707.1 M48 family metallopeptidase [Magnetospirillum sulfuroxidans]